MATACLTGLPALISALTFSLNAGLLGDFFSGISFTFCGFFGRLGRLFEVFGCGRSLAAHFVHFFTRASGDAGLFCVNITVQARFGSHYDPIHPVDTAPRPVLVARVNVRELYSR